MQQYVLRHPERLHSNQAKVDKAKSALTIESKPFFVKKDTAQRRRSEEDDIVLGKSIPSNEEYKLQIESSSDSQEKIKQKKKLSSTNSSSGKEKKKLSEKSTQVDIKILIKDGMLNSDKAKMSKIIEQDI